MKKVFVFGNEHLKEDAMAVKVCDHLDVQVEHCTRPEMLLEAEEEELIIIDVVKGLKEPQLILPEKIKTNKLMSLHDFDVGQVLALGQAMGIVKRLKIIGVPQEGNPKTIAEQVEPWI